jgi:TPR repeat protein
MLRTAPLVILIGLLASCASTTRDEEMADLRKQIERAENAAAEARAMAVEAKTMVEREAAERAAAEKAAAEAKAMEERAAAERAAAERAAAERAAAERAEADRLAADRAAAERPKNVVVAPAPAPWGGQALYEQALDLESEGRGAQAVRIYGRAARSGSGKAALRLAEIYENGIAGLAPNDPNSLRWYNIARMLGEDVPQSKIGSPAPGESLYEEALKLETRGRGLEALKIYVRAARAGNGMAALRLGEIYDGGIPGVSRDYAESLKWYNAARIMGEDVPMARSR